jgi:hypothetical protein
MEEQVLEFTPRGVPNRVCPARRVAAPEDVRRDELSTNTACSGTNLSLTSGLTPTEDQAMNFAKSHRRLALCSALRPATSSAKALQGPRAGRSDSRVEMFGSCLMIVSLLVMAMFG